ncbi:MAG: helix-turn-helix transcriptional regulator, partial [Clostridia bacterium]|nr:helix-turn-helix transcriptional regulator [Clostridia bacterium]
MDEFTQLGNAIKEARLKKGMSQEALAEALDISPTHVKHMESGHRRPSVEKLFQIAKLLDMSVDSVIFKKDS